MTAGARGAAAVGAPRAGAVGDLPGRPSERTTCPAPHRGGRCDRPAAEPSELSRSGGHDQTVDACLAREGGIAIAPTDRSLVRRIGHLLAAAGRGSKDHVDGSVVAVCAASGGGVLLTGDSADLLALSGSNPAITVTGIGRRS